MGSNESENDKNLEDKIRAENLLLREKGKTGENAYIAAFLIFLLVNALGRLGSDENLLVPVILCFASGWVAFRVIA
jgi:hypothetical protein